jgi:hypothetical protein
MDEIPSRDHRMNDIGADIAGIRHAAGHPESAFSAASL